MHSYVAQNIELLERWDLHFQFNLPECLCHLTPLRCRGLCLNTDLEDFYSRRNWVLNWTLLLRRMKVKLVFVLLRIYLLLVFDFILAFTLNCYFNQWGLQWRMLFLSSKNWNWIISNSLLRRMSKGVGKEKKRERTGHRDVGTEGHRHWPNLTEVKLKDQHLAQVCF
jgi:hypothetical protein